ncbi:Spy/CpxP family protein refolding chaperone [uncultured Enterovirga sp.]|uniref:Spy/CpxP family protein refolding chaperone n=1 Tax=uncultured Enterovirga sp. TaxID=2026352 RepID=UPI0035C9DA7C
MRRIVTGMVALVGVAAAAAAVAQGGAGRGDPDGPFRGGRGDRPMMSPSDREAFADARIAALKAGLRLTADQDKLWPPVEDALRSLAKQRGEARAARRERWASMRESDQTDIPARLRFMADRQAASAAALRRLADASTPLHASLDEGQRRRMQVLARFLGPGRGMKGGEGGGHERRMRRGAVEDGLRDFAESDRPARPATAR